MLSATDVRSIRLSPAAEALVFTSPSEPLRRIAVIDLTLGPGEALVSVELSTVCGSDLHTVHGHRGSHGPHVLGHEQVGRVMAIGPGDAPAALDGGRIAVGDRIVWGVAIDCGECRMCRRGMPNKCENVRKYGHEQIVRGWELSGGLASHVHLLARTPIVRVPESLPAGAAAPASCATATAVAALDAVTDTRPLAGETLVISGCGMLGLTAIALAREEGAHIVGVDPDPHRRQLARGFGADEVVDPAHMPQGFDAAIELSGSRTAVQSLLERAGVGAVIVLAGSVFPSDAVPLAAETVVRRLLTIRGVHNYRPEHLLAAVRFLCRTDATAFAGLVEAVVPLANAEQALAAAPQRGTRFAVAP